MNSRIMAIAKRLVYCMAITALVFPPMAIAQSLSQFRQAAERITSIRGEFIQEKHMPILARPLIARGYFAYQRPASLRWEYLHPMKSVMLLHGGTANRYIQSESGWVEDAASGLQSMDFILQEIANWLNGRFEDNPLFEVSLVADRKIVLAPKDESMARFIQRIELIMADQPGVMKAVLIYESADSFTRFKFVAPQLNLAIPESLFTKAP